MFFLSFLIFIIHPLAFASNSLRHSQANKRFIDQLKEGTYEIIHPFQMRDKSRERMGIDTREHFLNATPAQHFRQVTFGLRVNSISSQPNQRLRLSLTLNEHLLAAKSRLREIQPPGNGSTELEGNAIENCFYQGSIAGEPGSMVALSTCNGLWGILAYANGSVLGIWPLEGGDRGRRHPHVLFRAEMTEGRGAKCGMQTNGAQIEDEDGNLHGKRRRKRRRGEQQQKGVGQKLFLDLALIADLEMMRHFNFSRQKAVEYSLNVLNFADLLFRRGLNVRLAMSLLELWSSDSGQQSIGPTASNGGSQQQMLDTLLDYATGQLYGEEKDATILMTGTKLANNSTTTMAAVPDSVCTNRAVGLVQVPSPFGPSQTGIALAHTLGHILDIDHDHNECGCAHQQCLMSDNFGFPPNLSTSTHFLPIHFSACSSARLLAQIDHPSPNLQCLFARPLHPSTRLLLCGNGQLDGDEECDCGRRDQCQDPCCDPHSCRLRPHAQCASHQLCCHRCQFRPAGHLCRQSRSVCDLAERCDGNGGDCPEDGHLMDGTQCGLGGNGQCWQGECADGEAQCRQLWGQGARLADSLCFEQNGRALEYGNCGRDREGRFVECAPENFRCGLLHCREGAAIPTTLANSTSFSLQFSQGKRTVQCKVVTNSSNGMVQDGTGCGPGRICLHSVCLPLAQVSPPVQCPTNNLAIQCSGRGDCTSTRQCLCFDGWTGAACDLRSSSMKRTELTAVAATRGFSLDSISFLPPSTNNPGSRFGGRALETATLLAILLLVGLLLLLLLTCLLLFYRRKSSPGDQFRRRNGAGEGKSADEMDLGDEDGVGGENDGKPCENGGKAIKFGQMPSWREEKRKRKTNKRVYDALQRITEANEADSVSLKSRESSVAAGNSATTTPQSASIVQQMQPMPPPNINNGAIKQQNCAPSSLFTSGGIYIGNRSENNVIDWQSRGESTEGIMLDNCEEEEEETTTIMANHHHFVGPRLANLSLLMRKLDETIEGGGIDDFPLHQQQYSPHQMLYNNNRSVTGSSAAIVQPPTSADSGNAESSLDIRESPSLFSDPYRLDLPS